MYVMRLQMQNTVYPQRTHQAKNNAIEYEYNVIEKLQLKRTYNSNLAQLQ